MSGPARELRAARGEEEEAARREAATEAKGKQRANQQRTRRTVRVGEYSRLDEQLLDFSQRRRAGGAGDRGGRRRGIDCLAVGE